MAQKRDEAPADAVARDGDIAREPEIVDSGVAQRRVSVVLLAGAGFVGILAQGAYHDRGHAAMAGLVAAAAVAAARVRRVERADLGGGGGWCGALAGGGGASGGVQAGGGRAVRGRARVGG